ncbi:MAG: hemolysin family protein [Candidatus Omnitrophica bacterium]|nr:hemolysin family protein [Candidatus Omnitrophota bacterium]
MENFFTLPAIFTVLAVLVILSAFFSLSETSVIALSKIKLRHMVERGVRRARSVQRLVTKLDRFIAAILISNNFVNIAISAIVTAVFIGVFGPRKGVVAATFLSSLLILVFCDMIPKLIAVRFPDKMALLTSYIMEGLIVVLNPLVTLFTGFSSFVLKCFGVEPGKRKPLISEEELRVMIEVGKEEGVVSDEERKMLHRIFEFGDTMVSEVMVPKEKMAAMDISKGAEGLLTILTEEGYSRIPVYRDSIDNILGVIYARDILYIYYNKGLIVVEDILHQPLFVPPAKRVNELLSEFQTKKVQIAIIKDDKGITLGLVTLEDLLEEIVGEIEEEKHR